MLYIRDFYANLSKKMSLVILNFFLLPIYGLANTGMGPTAYIDFGFYESEIPNISFPINNLIDPGDSADVLWSDQFYFNNSLFSTIAMQKNGGSKPFFKWTVFGAKYFNADGTPGSVCQKFSDGIGGVSCSINYDWQEGHDYTLRVLPKDDEPGWYIASIDERQDSYDVNILNLGSIYVGATAIKSKSKELLDYYDRNNSRTVCLDSPYSKVVFISPYYRKPSSSLNSYADDSSPAKGPACQDMISIYKYKSQHKQLSAVWYAAAYEVSAGVGNSASSQVKPSSDLSQCIDITGGLAESAQAGLYSCKNEGTNDINQAMVYTSQNELRFAQNYCLTAQFDRTITLRTCNGSSNQKWQLTPDGRIYTLIDSYQANGAAYVITKEGSNLSMEQYASSNPQQVFTTQVLQNRH